MVRKLSQASRGALVALTVALTAGAPKVAVPEATPGPTDPHAAHSSAAHASAEAQTHHHPNASGSGGHGSHHVPGDECTCRGACAATAPRAAAADAETLASPDLFECHVETPHPTLPPPPTLWAYLFPLPNAPPLPA